MKANIASTIIFAAVFGGIFGSITTSALSSAENDGTVAIDELTVKRLNVVEEDGQLALVLSNSDHMPGVVRNGEERSQRSGVGGMLFYDSRGDEMGGLITRYADTDYGTDAGVALSMDQFNDQDQTVQLLQWANGDFVRTGLRIWALPTDQSSEALRTHPDVVDIIARLRAAETDAERAALANDYQKLIGELGLRAERLFLGSEGSQDRVVKLDLKDSRSQTRIRLSVDEQDIPKIEFFDAEGQLMRVLTDTADN